jgi:hypothetical protein
MVEQAKRDPTMEEIVVALRETRREAGRVPPFTVVGGQLAGSRTSSVARLGDDGAVTRSYGAVADAPGISDVYPAKDPFNATAKGALVGAMLNM